MSTPTAPGPYEYMLHVPGKISVIGKLPQEWALGVNATWEGNSTGSTAGEVLQNKFGSVGAIAASASGTASTGIDTLANRQYTGTSPLTFNLLANFVAETDAAAEVIVPILKLQSMCMPTQLLSLGVGKFSIGNVYTAPFFDTAASGQLGGRSQIELHIGSLFIFEDMVVESVVPTYASRYTADLLPTSAQVEIQVSTRHVFTFEDLLASIVNTKITDSDPYLASIKAQGAGARAGYSGATPTTPTN